MKKIALYLSLFFILLSSTGFSQSNEKDELLSEKTFKDLKFRNIGPAFMSGRIADIAIHPNDDNTWYVAVGSGGVWKTVNAGITWEPIFDNETSYSIGCVSIDSKNPNNIWVGTGENVGGRHVGFGDGIYKSVDAGKTWKNMGLKLSEHISKIIVHPTNSDIVWVAAQGPLWSKGGERGLYKTVDGGKTWKKTLGDDTWTGVTDLVIDPRNPDVLFAATWQRHRSVASYVGGGPGSGIHKSTDGGDTWLKLSSGLPEENMAKIGLAISPQQPDIVYAAIELIRVKGGIYRSSNSGMTWEKRSNVVSGATGPHYYQELYASPHQFERLYLVDNTMLISEDGGKNFSRMNNTHKHGDEHAVAFKKNDPDYVMVGSDGGLYESFDHTKNWRFMENLPITQFYKVALDDAEPFYNIYGGTQDNSTQGGPSRTDNFQGIQNSDWSVVLNWDGHQPATEPGNPNIMYAERQEGALSRIDLSTGEVIDIQPAPNADEDFERFNWDAPILVSPHSPTRIYFASQRVWKSENRGDEWKAISGDLTKNELRIATPLMDGTQSWDAAWDFNAMSNYNTITSLAESPKQEGLIYAGTDDGTIQVTEDGGNNWRKVDFGKIPGLPKTAFVNDIKADLFDAGTVYVSFDNHKYGDFSPYLYKSTDKGKSWKSISSNIPDRTLIWRLVQDHVKPELMFCATEFGVYFTINAGEKWIKLSGGIPTISFRDIAIQKRENDLVAASFGRGFFVLDDYSVLREITEEKLEAEASLFSTRKAWWYVPRSHLSFDEEKGSQGADHYVAPNPDFGAIFTYFLKDDLKTKEKIRQEKEKNLSKQSKAISFPGWDELLDEVREEMPGIYIVVSDATGKVIRRVKGPSTKGFHRVSWDLRYPATSAIRLDETSSNQTSGLLAAPGTYTAEMVKYANGKISKLSEAISFEVVPLKSGALKGASMEEVDAFWRAYEKVSREVSGMEIELANALNKIKAMQKALLSSSSKPGTLETQLFEVHQTLLNLDMELYGHQAKRQVGEKTKPNIGQRMFRLELGISRSTYGPTPTHRKQLKIVNDQLSAIITKLEKAMQEMDVLGKTLKDHGAPLVEGR